MARDSSIRFALAGAALGVLAPIGWACLKILFFGGRGEGFLRLLSGDSLGDPELLALNAYLGLGMGLALGAFGFYFGRSRYHRSQQDRLLRDQEVRVRRLREQLEGEIAGLSGNLRKFHASNAHLQRSLDRREVLRMAAENLHGIFGFDRVNLLMLTEDQTSFEFIASLGTGEGQVRGISLPCDERAGILYRAIREDRPFHVEDMAQMPPEDHLRPPCDAVVQLRSRSFIVCPISVNGRPAGIFGVDHKHTRRELGPGDLETVRLFAEQVAAALEKIDLLAGVERLTAELEGTFAGISGHEKQFDRLIRSLQSGTAATTETVGRVGVAAGVVSRAVEETDGATREIAATVGRVENHLQGLARSMTRARSALGEIEEQAGGVEAAAGELLGGSREVGRSAVVGRQAIEETSRGFERIARDMEQTLVTIRELTSKTEQIARVTGVIHEINQKTNLLSLNAAIIAAQSGEQGKSFGVVAGEIRHLADETFRSAEEIDSLLQEVRRAAGRVMTQAESSRSLVEREQDLGARTDAALGEILERAEAAIAMAEGILEAAGVQSSSARLVSGTFAELDEMSDQVAGAYREQNQGLERIIRALGDTRTSSEEMVQATLAHEQETRRIDQEVDTLQVSTGEIFAEMARRQEAGRQVMEQIRRYRHGRKQEPSPAPPGSEAAPPMAAP